MRASLLALLQRRTRQPIALGILVAVLLLTVETVIAELLTSFVPARSVDVVYLLGILVVAFVWEYGLGIAMALASVLTFHFFFIPPTLTFGFARAQDAVVLAIFLVIALLACSLSRLARSLTSEVDARVEADFAAELARLLLHAPDLRTALPAAARHLARTFELPSASIERGPVPPDQGDEAFRLGGETTLATLLVPAGTPRATMRRLRDRAVPSLEVLLQAARERECVADALRASRDEQAALRRLATLVAHGVSPDQVLDAVAVEMGRILGAGHTQLNRYEPDGTVTCVGTWNKGDIQATMPLGARWPLEKGTISELVARTRAPGRISFDEDTGEASARFRARGIHSCVGCPIVVGRSLWGVAVVNSTTRDPLPPDTEERIRDFADLTAAAIANAQSNAELKASRARLVAAADQARRRIERNLHDGTQQRLVTIGLEARAIGAMVPPGMDQLTERLAHMAQALADTIEDLQEISRGLHPATLAKSGLPKALNALARRSAVTVDLDVSLDRRLPERLEVTLYYIVSEALTNAVKHAHASAVHVGLTEHDSVIRLSIHDDGIGGADPASGSGLIGLTDRVEAIGGKLEIKSPPGQGTALLAEIPTDDG